MIAKIAPLVRLPGSVDVFDYHIPDELSARIAAGSLVAIPFRSKTIHGVVIETTEKTAASFRARPITDMLEEKPILSEEQIKLISRFSDHYYAPRALIVRLIVPDRPKRLSASKETTHPVPPFLIEQQASVAIEALVAENDSLPREMRIQDLSSFLWFLKSYARKSKKGITIIAPTIATITLLAQTLKDQFPDRVVCYHSEMSKGQQWNAYRQSLHNAERILISTRQGALLPLPRGGVIFIYDATSEDLKQTDQHPRYDARTVALWHAQYTESSLTLVSHSERIALKNEKPLMLPRAGGPAVRTSLIDIKREQTASEGRTLSFSAYEHINKTLKEGKRVLIASMRRDSEAGISARGILKELTDIQKNCTIGILDTNSKNVPNSDIIIATTGSLESLKLLSERSSIGLLLIASIEPLLALPDFRSAERAYHKLGHLKMIAQELRIPHLALQAFGDDNRSVRAAIFGEYEQFKAAELTSRKELHYPPFTELIKISQKKDSAPSVKDLMSRIPQSSAYRVQGPYTDHNGRVSILIKMSRPETIPLLRELSSEWIIDREPENIL